VRFLQESKFLAARKLLTTVIKFFRDSGEFHLYINKSNLNTLEHFIDYWIDKFSASVFM